MEGEFPSWGVPTWVKGVPTWERGFQLEGLVPTRGYVPTRGRATSDNMVSIRWRSSNDKVKYS